MFGIVLMCRLWSFRFDAFGLKMWEHRDRTSIYESIDMILNYSAFVLDIMCHFGCLALFGPTITAPPVIVFFHEIFDP
jgi:hypothetical protein